MKVLSRAFSIGIISTLIFVPFVQAASLTQAEQDRTACMEKLGFSEAQLKIGTFMYLLRECESDKRTLRLTQDRANRLRTRDQKIRSRLINNSRFTRFRTDVQNAYKRLQTNRVEQTQQRKIEGTQTFRRFYDVTKQVSNRARKRMLEQNEREKREESSAVFQSLRSRAYEACRHVNGTNRNNCIRAKLRELGSQ